MNSEFTYSPECYVNGIIQYYVPSHFGFVDRDDNVDIFENADGITLSVEVLTMKSPPKAVQDPVQILNTVLAGVSDHTNPVLLTTGFGFASYIDQSEVEDAPEYCVQLCCPHSPGKLVVVQFSLIVPNNYSAVQSGLTVHAVRSLARWTKLHEK